MPGIKYPNTHKLCESNWMPFWASVIHVYIRDNKHWDSSVDWWWKFMNTTVPKCSLLSREQILSKCQWLLFLRFLLELCFPLEGNKAKVFFCYFLNFHLGIIIYNTVNNQLPDIWCSNSKPKPRVIVCIFPPKSQFSFKLLPCLPTKCFVKNLVIIVGFTYLQYSWLLVS